MTTTRQALETRPRAVSIALAFAIVLLPALGAAPAAEGQTYTVLYNFTGGPDGGWPYYGLVRDAKGNLYGTTYYGGDLNCDYPYGCGVVFKLDNGGKETTLYTFTETGGDGANPAAGLVIDSSGNLYGTTYYGGASGDGTVFKLDSSGNETVLHSFTGYPDDGAYPFADLVRDAAGNLYGTTYSGGAGEVDGTVFEVDKAGNETMLHSFTGGDGQSPSIDPLFLDAAGNVYGTTHSGGPYQHGVVFKLDKTGEETLLYTFPGLAKGAFPTSGLIRDPLGNLYGTTARGGSGACHSGCGVVFKLAKTGKVTVLYSFAYTGDGTYPSGDLLRDAMGNLYGTTFEGGGDDVGTLFELNKAGKETVLHSFAGPDGELSYGGLVRDASGNLYGAASRGGAYGGGVVFELTP